MIKDLIEVKQLPVIEEQLRSVSKVIEERVKNATNLVCTEESVKTIKEIRAELNKDYKEFEAKRKLVKEQVLKPYNDFENVYKECISDKFKNADLILKGKIDNVENELKAKKEQEVKDYFEEYKTANNIDFITYGQAKINVTLSASMKGLKEQAKSFIDKISEDLKLIETQEHKAEILVEYKETLNVSNAIMTVTNRFKAIEEEKKKEEEQKVNENLEKERKQIENNLQQLANANIPQEQPSTAEEIKNTEKIYTITFKVTGTATKLKQLKQYLLDGGYQYE